MEKLFFLMRHSLGERARRLRTELKVQIRPENLYTMVARLRGDFDQIFAAPLPIRQVSPKVVKSGRQKDSAINTYGISYVGHLDFGEAKAVDDLGIPCYVLEDGTVTLYSKDVGLEPRAQEEGAACSIDGRGC